MIAAVRMYWTPTVCWVQPTEYTNAEVRSRPEFRQSDSATWRFRDSAPNPQPALDRWNMHVDNIEGAGGSLRVCNFSIHPN